MLWLCALLIQIAWGQEIPLFHLFFSGCASDDQFSHALSGVRSGLSYAAQTFDTFRLDLSPQLEDSCTTPTTVKAIANAVTFSLFFFLSLCLPQSF
jgi:hypothetical protein